jgi:alpha-L-arabinofuranosidase
MQDVLVVAMYLNTFIRHANIVKMANMAQLVNVIAPMMVTDDKLWLQTIYYPLQLFAQHCEGYSLDASVFCDTYDEKDYKQIPYLDVSASFNDKKGEIIISVVNRNENKAIETSIVNQSGMLDNQATVYEINSPNLTDENSVHEQKVKSVQKDLRFKGDNFEYTFPAHSFTMIKLKLKS